MVNSDSVLVETPSVRVTGAEGEPLLEAVIVTVCCAETAPTAVGAKTVVAG